MGLRHLTPLDREYYEAVSHANSDATTPGFFKVPPMPYGFAHRLNMPDKREGRTKKMSPAHKFLQSLTDRLLGLGHDPVLWQKGRWGFICWCRTCGAHASCCVTRNRVREFPQDTCAEREKSLRKASTNGKPQTVRI